MKGNVSGQLGHITQGDYYDKWIWLRKVRNFTTPEMLLSQSNVV